MNAPPSPSDSYILNNQNIDRTRTGKASNSKVYTMHRPVYRDYETGESEDDESDSDDESFESSNAKRKSKSNANRPPLKEKNKVQKRRAPAPAATIVTSSLMAKRGPDSPDRVVKSTPKVRAPPPQVPQVIGDPPRHLEFEQQTEVLRVDKILASRNETQEAWDKIMAAMNTDVIANGSMFVFDAHSEVKPQGNVYVERFLVKWTGYSYLHLSWETQSDLYNECGKQTKAQITRYFSNASNGYLLPLAQRGPDNYFPVEWVQIERVLDVDDGKGNHGAEAYTDDVSLPVNAQIIPPKDMVLDREDQIRFNLETSKGRQFLIKWHDTPFRESISSYEYERDLVNFKVGYLPETEAFYKRERKLSEQGFAKLAEANVAANVNDILLLKKGYTKDQSGKLVPPESRGQVSANVEKNYSELKAELMNKEWVNGGKLREYQAEGVAWLYRQSIQIAPNDTAYLSAKNPRGAMIADEMGLGKTLQTVAFIDALKNRRHVTKPSLVIVPLSTISHWQREFLRWTNLNVVVYHGRSEDRDMIRKLEFGYDVDKPAKNFDPCDLSMYHQSRDSIYYADVTADLSVCTPLPGPSVIEFGSVVYERKLWKAEVVITTPETFTKGDSGDELRHIDWQVLVMDEAHRLKNSRSRISQTLSSDIKYDFKLGLTGTPLQNNMSELWSLLHFVDPLKFPKEEEEDSDSNVEIQQFTEKRFNDKFEGISDSKILSKLHEVIGSYILRRLKEDVEKSVPPKSETIVSCIMPLLQKQQYRAIYEKNIKLLVVDTADKLVGPNLNNVAMELRKCCNHPFLIGGGEEKLKETMRERGEHISERSLLTEASGKFKLLDKLLPKLKSEGHRVLIFSQFVMMLDILEDYLRAHAFEYGRIDGKVTGLRRQSVIDHFQGHKMKKGSEPPFAMLLSTRAGGVGINLTAADTVIIYDSDWNPQNDLQAMARCHRIGQTRPVSVYRLLTRQTYEEKMFHDASLKMGLDEVVLHKMSKQNGDNPDAPLTPAEVERLLKVGAMDIFNEEGDEDSNNFAEMTIEEILAQSKTIVHDDSGADQKAGGVFSKVTFDDEDEKGRAEIDVKINDADFWKKTMGEDKFKKLTAVEKLQKRKERKDYAEMSDYQFMKKLRPTETSGDGKAKDGGMEFTWRGKRRTRFPPTHKASKHDLGDEVFSGDNSDGEDDFDSNKIPKLWDNPFTKHFCEETWRAVSSFGLGKWETVKEHSPSLSEQRVGDIKYAAQSLALLYFYEAVEDTAVETFFSEVEKGKARYRRELEDYNNFMMQRASNIAKGERISKEPNKPEPNIPKEEEIISGVFKLLWNQHKFWLMPLFVEILSIEKTDKGLGRKEALAVKAVPTAASEVHNKALESFFTGLWPQLQSRGWKNVAAVGVMAQPPKGSPQSKILHCTVRHVLVTARELHKDLKKIIDQIFDIDGEEAAIDHEASTAVIRKDGSVNASILQDAKIASTVLDELISWYCPSAMRNDEAYRQYLGRNKVRLTNVQYIEALRFPLNPVNTKEGQGPFRIPFPTLGKPDEIGWGHLHDRAIVRAVKEHGWIENGEKFNRLTENQSSAFSPPYGMGVDEDLFDVKVFGKKDALLVLDSMSERARGVVTRLYGKSGKLEIGRVKNKALLGKLQDVQKSCSEYTTKVIPESGKIGIRCKVIAKEIIKATQLPGGYDSIPSNLGHCLDNESYDCALLVHLIEAATGGSYDEKDSKKIGTEAKSEFETVLAFRSEEARRELTKFGQVFDRAKPGSFGALRKLVGLPSIEEEGGEPTPAMLALEMCDARRVEVLVLGEVANKGLPILGFDESAEFNVSWSSLRNDIVEGAKEDEETLQFCGDGAGVEFKKKVIGLVEAVRQAGIAESEGDADSFTGASDDGLGLGVMEHGGRLLWTWGKAVGIVEGESTGYEGPAYGLLLGFEQKDARSIFAQISQQTRLREVYLKLGLNGVAKKANKVINKMAKAGDVWEDQPDWWAGQCDLGLLTGLLERGWRGFESIFTGDRYRLMATHKEAGAKGDLVQAKAKCFKRVYQMTREYSLVEMKASRVRKGEGDGMEDGGGGKRFKV